MRVKDKLIWASLDSISLIGLQFISIIVLSKILSPSEYGIIGMMTVFIAVGNVVVDSGLGGALIKKQNPTIIDYSTLFWYNFIVSLVIYTAIFILSPIVAAYYNLPQLEIYLKTYCLVIIISGIDIIQRVKLLKDLKFKLMTIATIGSGIIAFIIAYICAINGLGVWSLIIQQIILVLVKTLIHVWIVRIKLIFKFSKASFRESFTFGFSILCANVISNVYGNIVSLIIPKVTSITDNGYYLQASRIKNVPISLMINVVDKVLFPLYSKIENETDKLMNNRIYVRKISVLVSICLFLFIVFSKLIVEILLGEKWGDVVSFLRILLLASFFQLYISLGRNYIKSLGKSKLIFNIELISSIIGIIVIILSSFWGMRFILYGLVISGFIISIISSILIDINTPYKFKHQINDIGYALMIFFGSIFYMFYF